MSVARQHPTRPSGRVTRLAVALVAVLVTVTGCPNQSELAAKAESCS